MEIETTHQATARCATPVHWPAIAFRPPFWSLLLADGGIYQLQSTALEGAVKTSPTRNPASGQTFRPRINGMRLRRSPTCPPRLSR